MPGNSRSNVKGWLQNRPAEGACMLVHSLKYAINFLVEFSLVVVTSQTE